MTNRMDHTNCTHPRTPKGRAACRAGRPTFNSATGVLDMGTPAVKAKKTMTAAEMGIVVPNRPTINTPAGKIRVGSVIIASVRSGGTQTYTVLEVSDDIKNGYAGWSADGRWGYDDQVVRVVKF